jgi:hypothetical protein
MNKENQLKPLFIITSLIIISAIPTIATAELSLSAGIKSRSEFNDNIFLDRSDNEGKESDFISRIGPELKLDYASRSVDTKLTYSYERRNYLRNSNENEDVQAFDFGSQIRPIKDLLYVDVGTIQAATQVDSRRASGFNNLLNNRTEQRGLTISPYLSRQLNSSLAVTSGYSFSDIDFTSTGGSGSSGDGEDHKEYNFFSSLAKKVGGKTTLSLNYNNLRHQATINSSYNRNDLSLAGDYLATKRITFDGELGRHWFNFDGISNSNDGFGHITGSYLLTRNKTIELGYSVMASGVSGFENIAPAPEEPEGPVADEIEGFGDTQGGATFTRRFDATFKRRGKVNSTVNLYTSDIDYSESNRKDELRGFTLRFARQISGRTTGFIRGLAEKRNFIGGGLSSEVTSYRYSLETSLSYRLTSRFTANVGYNYNTEKSSKEESNYNNNILWLRIGVNLPELQKIIK